MRHAVSTVRIDPVAGFLQALEASLENGTFVRLMLSRRGSDPTATSCQRVLGRLIDLRGQPHLSFTLRFARRDEVKNVPLNESVGWVKARLSSEFSNALLGTTERDWQLSGADTPPEARLVRHKPAMKEKPPRQHDRSSSSLLDATAQGWLGGLGVTDAQGRVLPSMTDKFRQISHYLEILSHLWQELGWHKGTEQPERVIVDMGCGKGYLTFGAWHLLRKRWDLPVRILGVEARAELVLATNQLAKQIQAEGLEFIQGTISEVTVPPMDVLIALHACDTATDQAIGRGIAAGARLIIVAPCCHKEVRPQLGHPEPLAPVLRHGILEERMAEWVTDGLRALFLEWAGYRTKVFEFVASEHTPKNLMIVAVRDRAPFTDHVAKERLANLRAFFAIKEHALDRAIVRPT